VSDSEPTATVTAADARVTCEEALRPALRVLHTSDVHVYDSDSSIASLGGVVDVALAERVDLVLIAGDLFDHPRIADSTGDKVVAELARLEQPAVVIPGNHDCIDEESLYKRVDLTQAGPHVHFVGDPEGSELIFEELGLAIWARGIEEHTPTYRPLSSYRPSHDRYWRLAMAHGFFVPAGADSYRSSQIHEDEIAALACDYLAMGHVHVFRDVSAGDVTAYYSGSPDTGVSIVNLDPEAGISIDRRQLGALVPAE
jgi:DNA repair exonuclease SbcCD nuclease subunit